MVSSEPSPAPLQPLGRLPAAHIPWLVAPFLCLQNRKHHIALTFLLLSYLSVSVLHFSGFIIRLGPQDHLISKSLTLITSTMSFAKQGHTFTGSKD